MITRVPFVIHGGVRVADLQIGDFLDVRDTLGYWLIATVKNKLEETETGHSQVEIHYENWSDKYNEWFDATVEHRLAKLGQYTICEQGKKVFQIGEPVRVWVWEEKLEKSPGGCWQEGKVEEVRWHNPNNPNAECDRHARVGSIWYHPDGSDIYSLNFVKPEANLPLLEVGNCVELEYKGTWEVAEIVRRSPNNSRVKLHLNFDPNRAVELDLARSDDKARLRAMGSAAAVDEALPQQQEFLRMQRELHRLHNFQIKVGQGFNVRFGREWAVVCRLPRSLAWETVREQQTSAVVSVGDSESTARVGLDRP